MRTIVLHLSYLGTAYCGWQIQARGESVQGLVQAAVRRMTGEANSVVGASRTDAGVHALMQVAHFATRTTIPADGFARGLQEYLPRDIVVCAAHEASAGFNARRASRRKHYRYLIHESRTPHVMLRDRMWLRFGPLRLRAMQAAARVLVGRHDFRAFAATPSPSKTRAVEPRTTIRLIEACTVRSVPWTRAWPLWEGDGRVITMNVIGNGFLKQMVRTMAGTLVAVGEGKLTPTDVRRILRSHDRKQAGVCAPACGLYLVRVA